MEKYHIQLEMAAETYVLGIITMCDTKEGFDRLAKALLEIDKSIVKLMTEVSHDGLASVKEDQTILHLNVQNSDSSDGWNPLFGWEKCDEDIVYSLAEVKEKDAKEVLIEKAEGSVCAGYVNLYPPGIPLLLPGERITKEHITLINRYLEKDMHVQGVTERLILVCR